MLCYPTQTTYELGLELRMYLDAAENRKTEETRCVHNVLSIGSVLQK